MLILFRTWTASWIFVRCWMLLFVTGSGRVRRAKLLVRFNEGLRRAFATLLAVFAQRELWILSYFLVVCFRTNCC